MWLFALPFESMRSPSPWPCPNPWPACRGLWEAPNRGPWVNRSTRKRGNHLPDGMWYTYHKEDKKQSNRCNNIKRIKVPFWGRRPIDPLRVIVYHCIPLHRCILIPLRDTIPDSLRAFRLLDMPFFQQSWNDSAYIRSLDSWPLNCFIRDGS